MQNARLRCLVCVALLAFAPILHADELKLGQRRPVRSALTGDGFLYVANSESGSISIIDTSNLKLVNEVLLDANGPNQPSGLSDLVAIPNSAWLLAADFEQHRLHLLERVQPTSDAPQLGQISKRSSIEVAKFPVTISVSRSGTTICVASLWSRRLTIIDLELAGREVPNLKIRHSIDLDFAPRIQQFLDEKHVAVFDGFGGNIATIDIAAGKTVGDLATPWHNMRGVSLDGTGNVCVTHQLLRSSAHTEREHVHWGVLLENQISTLPVAQFVNATRQASGEIVGSGKSRDSAQPFGVPLSIGEAGDAAGDPGEIVLSNDRIYVAISGTNQVAMIDRVGVRELRAEVGARPVALSYDSKSNRVFVVNSLGDSVSVIDAADPRRVQTISLGPSRDLSPKERGERLFFDARLSLDGWMSCHSCHTDGHSMHRLADTMGDGEFGNAKRIPSLLGTRSSAPWAWSGSKKALADQLAKTLLDTMHGPDHSRQTISDLTMYLKSLEPAPSIALARGEVDQAKLDAGREVFRQQGCATCHVPPTYTSPATYDVGLRDEKGKTKFNPPSLLGVSQRDRLFHDGRAIGVDDVIRKFRHQITEPLSPNQADVLNSFLRTL